MLALAFGSTRNGSGTPSDQPSSTPPVTVAAPPLRSSTERPCTKVLEQLPPQLGRLAARVVHPAPDSPFVVAWGDPAVVLSCGVARPKDLVVGSTAQYFSATGLGGPYYDAMASSDAEVYTTVDRSVYIAVAIPASYASGPLPALSRAIARALPAVCTVNGAAPDLSRLCTRRP